MAKEWKLVRNCSYCDDKYLIGLYDTKEDAEKDKEDGMYVDKVDPMLIDNPNDSDFSHYIYSLIPKEDTARVFKSDASAEIGPHCMTCGNRTYYWLSKTIDKDWTVIDMGCSYNAQSYLFTEHARYIAVDLPFSRYTDFYMERFFAEGTELYEMEGKKWIKEVLPTLELDLDMTFCICNYVPDDSLRKLVNETFPNVYNVYPKLSKK